jgi:acyl carrier protein
MSNPKIHDQVAQVFRDETMLPLTELSDEATGETLGLDSLDWMEIVIALEDHFDIEIGDEEWGAVDNFGQAVALVESKMAVKV